MSPGGQGKRFRRSGGRGALRTAVLAALVEQPGHGYDLTNRINQRMGPVLQAHTRRVYELLEQLEREQLASSAGEHTSDAPHRSRRVFSPTQRARQVHECLLRQRQPVPVARVHIHALLAFSTPEQAPQLLAMLDEYEVDCIEMHEQVLSGEVRGTSWRSRMISGARAAVAEQLAAELRWIARARREIEEYLSEGTRPA